MFVAVVAAACSSRVVTEPSPDGGTSDGLVLDDGTDLGPYAGDAWWLTWDAPTFDAPTFDAPPAIGMYPPNGAGPCSLTGCALSSSQCFRASGWCCEGYPDEGGPYPCSCGKGLGCLPPNVCCYRGTDPNRSCGSVTSCR